MNTFICSHTDALWMPEGDFIKAEQERDIFANITITKRLEEPRPEEGNEK